MNTITNIRVVANDHSVFDGIFNVYIGFAQRKPIHFQLTEQNIMFLFGGVLQQNAVQIALTEWRNSNPEKWARQYGAEYQSHNNKFRLMFICNNNSNNIYKISTINALLT